jgi:superfamily II DNA or RNA helicase
VAVPPRLAQWFSRTAVTRGDDYLARGAVRDLARDGDSVSARVLGTSLYDVRLLPNGEHLRARCSCPFHHDTGALCKHVWAVLRATADARLIPLDGLTLIVAADDPAPAPATRRRPAPHHDPPPPPPLWRRQLDALRTAAAIPREHMATPAPDTLVYVVDIDASRESAQLVIEVMERTAGPRGWTKPRAARLARSTVHAMPAGPDRTLLERILGLAFHSQWAIPSTAPETWRRQLEGPSAADLLAAMCATGRCVVRVRPATARPAGGGSGRWWNPKPPPPAYHPIEWDGDSPWTFETIIRRDDSAHTYVVSGRFTRAGDEMPVDAPLLVTASGIVITATHAGSIDDRGGWQWLAMLRHAGVVTVPCAARAELIEALVSGSAPVVDAPPEMHVELVDVHAVPVLLLSPAPGGALFEGEVAFDYGPTRVVATDPRTVLAVEPTRAMRRNVAGEHERLAALDRAGVRHGWSYRFDRPTHVVAAADLSRIVAALIDEGWRVEVDGRAYRRHDAVAMAVTSGIDWFELTGHASFGEEEVPLPRLLEAVRKGEPFVPLDDGSMGLVPAEWLRKHTLLTRVAAVHGDALTFRRSQAALLDALLAVEPAVTCDALFERARRELHAFDRIGAADPPSGFRGHLREYQRDGLGWLLFLRRFAFGGCLADDMGLGKTVMVLALLAGVHGDSSRGVRRPSLIVAPRSLVFNWRREAERFAPALRVLEYSGTKRSGSRAQFGEYDLILTTYGTVRRDAAHLAATAFEYVVLDEAQAVKTATSASAKAVRLLHTDHRLALTGTPVENHLGELWTLFEFLNPGVLGSSGAFAGVVSRTPDADTLSILRQGLRPFILRRTKAQVARELPEKTEQTIFCELARPQRALYDELRDYYRRTLLDGVATRGVGRTKFRLLEGLLRLRQAACHPGLIDPERCGDDSAKLDALLPLVTEAVDEGHKVLVFSQFTSLLAIVRARLDAARIAYEYLDGATTDRQAHVDRFQTDPECRLFLISLKAGGVGLNLTAAEYVFLLDPWWNPAVEAQAIDRAHRIGQTRQVFGYRLIAKDTVEERVLELQQRKRTLADAVISADESVLRTLQREDLELLLS